MRHIRGIAFFAAKLAISLALIYFAVDFVNFSALRGRVKQLDYVWLAAALVTLAVQTALLSARWRRIAMQCDAPMSGRRALLYTLIGVFFSQVLPSTVGGDAARMWLLARDTKTWKGSIFSVLIDRATGLIWLAAFVLVCLPWSLALIRNPVGRTALVLIGGAGVAAPIGLYVLSLAAHTSLARWNVVRHMAGVATSALNILTSARSGPGIAIVSIVIHVLTVLILWFCAQAAGSQFTLTQSLLLVPPVTLIAAVPISIAGWGVRESAMIAAFTYAGLPNSDGLLVSLLFGAGMFITGAVGGIAWILSSNRVWLGSLREATDRAAKV